MGCKVKRRDTYFCHIGGHRIAHICGPEMVLGVEDDKEEFCGLVLRWGGCA